MTAWRWPTVGEQREDYGLLRGCLPDDVARRIAALPIVVIRMPDEMYAPLALRIDGWLWRTSRLLADQSWQRTDMAPDLGATPVFDMLPVIQEWAAAFQAEPSVAA